MAALMLMGCSINPQHVHVVQHAINQIKRTDSIYVIVNKADDRRWVGIAGEIKSELEKLGFKPAAGELADKPVDTDFYVSYKVGWGVDFLVVYIRSLDIRIYDQENRIIAEGRYDDKNFLHRIPRSAEIVNIIIKDMFSK